MSQNTSNLHKDRNGPDWWCGTPDCIEMYHYHPPCRHCGLSKKHLDDLCPKLYRDNKLKQSGLIPRKCHVVDCTENHVKHYCNVCKNQDSSHRARDCRMHSSILLYCSELPPLTVLKCRVDGCDKNHSSHYCKRCKKNNVSHFSRRCLGV